MTDTDPTTDHHATYRAKGIDDLREIYADEADLMARLGWIDRLVLGGHRRRLFSRASGRVLDVACGTGINVRYLPRTTDYVGVDISPEMLAKATARFDRLERGESLLEMDAQDLDLPEDSFDTVISSLSTCTFPDPSGALGEMARVCRPDGRILLLEHGRSDLGPIARFQDWHADAYYEKHGCRWSQEPVDTVRDAGLEIRDATTAMAGIITAIEARPE